MLRIHSADETGRSMRVTRRKLQTPGTAEEHKTQETPTINPNDRQPTQLTDEAPSTIERAARESRRITPISTAAVHAFSTATTRLQTLTQQGHHQILSANAARCGLGRTTPQTRLVPVALVQMEGLIRSRARNQLNML